jgi:hypothetical protein
VSALCLISLLGVHHTGWGKRGFVSNSGTRASNMQNTASQKYNDGISLLISKYLFSVLIILVMLTNWVGCCQDIVGPDAADSSNEGSLFPLSWFFPSCHWSELLMTGPIMVHCPSKFFPVQILLVHGPPPLEAGDSALVISPLSSSCAWNRIHRSGMSSSQAFLVLFISLLLVLQFVSTKYMKTFK